MKLLITHFNQDYISLLKLTNKDFCKRKDTVLDLPLQKTLKIGDEIKTWLFTRHGPSCNNITGPMNKTMEPNLTDGGLKRLIDFKHTHNDKFKSNYVFVEYACA